MTDAQSNAMMTLLRRFVDDVVDLDFDFTTPKLSYSELASVRETYSAIERCLDKAQSPESRIEMTRLLIHNGIAGAFADHVLD